MRKRERADPTDITTYNDLNDQVEALKANIDYIHENIQECQENIMSMEESKVSQLSKFGYQQDIPARWTLNMIQPSMEEFFFFYT